MIAAVVPVKALASSKSRLLPHLGREAVERLSVAMLTDVLDALCAVPALDRVAVVTPDPAVAKVARAAGAEVLLRDVPGLNPSIEHAAAELAPGSDDTLLVVLGDVAGVQPADIEALLGSVGARGVAWAPSSDGGTSALVRRPRDVIAAGFGPASASVHRARAEDAGVPYRELALASLAIDIDEPGDVARFRRAGPATSRTRALLDELLASDTDSLASSREAGTGCSS